MMRRLSIYILAILSLIIMFWGLMYLFRIHIMNYHVAYLAMTEEQLNAVDKNIVPLYLTLMKIMGACMLAIGATTLVVTVGPLRRGQPWGWWSLITLLPVPLIVTSYLTYQVASQISNGSRPPFWLALGILVVFLATIGFCYPRKDK
ncbi:MAG: hypothetical protein D4R67_09675 [Bacteroidetes bacterium]|nr:MAG: hypothetical protein D4R67_09675 [Bacteroidota bacterium]